MDKELGEIGLSTAQYAVLTAIDEEPGSSGAQVARRCFMTPQSVNGLIATLEREKLIVRTASEKHGRIIEMKLSASGRLRLKTAHRMLRDIEKQMLQLLDEDQQKSLALLLDRCLEGISA